MNPRVDSILEFWFGPNDQPRQALRVWFVADPAFDRRCIDGFSGDYENAAAGELNEWQSAPRGALALILLLDQFPRNMFRGRPQAFATDAAARAASRDTIAKRFHLALDPVERSFIYMPFMHGENPQDQTESIRLFRELAEAHPDRAGNLHYAEHHSAVIRRFGRFPHRNAILGRRSTREEEEFLNRESKGA